jgi:hypothetical protein
MPVSWSQNTVWRLNTHFLRQWKMRSQFTKTSFGAAQTHESLSSPENPLVVAFVQDSC